MSNNQKEVQRVTNNLDLLSRVEKAERELAEARAELDALRKDAVTPSAREHGLFRELVGAEERCEAAEAERDRLQKAIRDGFKHGSISHHESCPKLVHGRVTGPCTCGFDEINLAVAGLAPKPSCEQKLVSGTCERCDAPVPRNNEPPPARKWLALANLKDPLAIVEKALKWVTGDYNECVSGGHESPPSELCVHHMVTDAVKGLASVRAHIAALEEVQQLATEVVMANGTDKVGDRLMALDSALAGLKETK